MGFRGQDEALAWGPWHRGLGRAREQHPSCLLHSQPHMPSSATIPSMPLPGAPGAIPMGTGDRTGQQGPQALLTALVLASV